MPLQNVLADEVQEFHRLKGLAEAAVNQVNGNDFFRTLDEESNSIASLMKHIAGNLLSRWTDFLTSDGDKPDRNRDAEFVTEEQDSRDKILTRWDDGWQRLLEALASLASEDMEKTIHIRSEPLSAKQAVVRSLSHCAYHIGQIVFLAKHFTGKEWQTLSIPRGKSEEFRTIARRQFEQSRETK